MVETVSVFLSGPAFSLLLYENVRSDYNQEGFLLGEIIARESNSMTDHEDQVVKINQEIKINSAIPCPSIGYFYDAAGKIDERKIQAFLGNGKGEVVAWYKFKRSNAFKITVRDKIVHKNLAKCFGLAENLFTCCLLTSSFNRSAATHLYSQIVIRYSRPVFQNLPIHIVNLSDPSHLYKNPEACSEVFSNLVQSLNVDNSKVTQSMNVITKVNAALQKHTDKLVVKLCKAELKMCELQQEIANYKQKIKEKEDNKMRNKFVPIENGDNITENLLLPQNSPELIRKGTAKGKRSRNNSLKGPNKDDDNRTELRSSNRNLRTTVAQNKVKK